MKKPPLLTCPFCGGKAKLVTLWAYVKKDGSVGIARLDRETPWKRVRCELCEAGSKALPGDDAMTVWNKRVTA